MGGGSLSKRIRGKAAHAPRFGGSVLRFARYARLGAVGVVAVSLKLALSPHGASAQSPPSVPSAPCDEWDVEYALTASMELSDTPLGQGDGVYSIGPGRMVLRFEDRGGQPGGRATMTAYRMHQAFTVLAKTLFWKTTVVNNAETVGVVDACGPPEGLLEGTTVTWKAPIHSFRTEGTLTCDGSFCGKFGAPPPGVSPLQIGPIAVLFQPLQFSSDMKTFGMGKTFIARMESPKQTAHIAVAGRETSRSCRPKTCP
jgi:hypothetical protein